MFKPVDLQTIMPRSFDLQKVEHVNNTRYITDQQQMSKQAVQESKHRQEQVQQSDPSGDGNRIRDDQQSRERKGRRYRRFSSGKKQEASETDEASKLDLKRGNIIDIKI